MRPLILYNIPDKTKFHMSKPYFILWKNPSLKHGALHDTRALGAIATTANKTSCKTGLSQLMSIDANDKGLRDT